MIVQQELYLQEMVSNGKKEMEGEYLINAQGEDVVAGVRTGKNIELLKKDMPKSHKN